MATYNIEALKEAGFELTHYEGQEGDFWTKHSSVGELADPRQFLNSYVSENADIVIEVCSAKGTVQWFLPDQDENADYPVGSAEADKLLWQAGLEL